MTLNDGLITAIEDKDESFGPVWSLRVFEVFVRYVAENHSPEDEIMFGTDRFDQEILDLYEVNTARFVEAQQAGG